MAESYAEWSNADVWYHQFYAMEAEYHRAMASDPPQVRIAYKILRQMYDRTAWVLKDDKKRKQQIEENLRLVREYLFDAEFSQYAFAWSVRSRMMRQQQESLDLLSEAQRELFVAMDRKKMLIPMSKGRSSGYSSIGAGGVME